MTTTEREELWGGETSKAIDNFPVSGEPIPVSVARWLGRIKAASARANAELGLLGGDIAERVAKAGDRVAAGEFDDQFPIDVFQNDQLVVRLVPRIDMGIRCRTAYPKATECIPTHLDWSGNVGELFLTGK